MRSIPANDPVNLSAAEQPTIEHEVLSQIQSDPYGESLGVEFEEIRPGYARVALNLQPEQLNFMGRPHGGVIFSLADVALSAASNAGGTPSALTNLNLNYLAAAPADARLTAEASEVSLRRRIGLYQLDVRSEEGELVASGQATVYRWS